MELEGWKWYIKYIKRKAGLGILGRFAGGRMYWKTKDLAIMMTHHVIIHHKASFSVSLLLNGGTLSSYGNMRFFSPWLASA